MKTMFLYMMFSAIVSTSAVKKEVPLLEEHVIVKDLNKAELTDWKVGSIKSNLVQNAKAELLPTPQFETQLEAATSMLGDKCYEAVSLQFYKLEDKAEVTAALNTYINERALLFPTAPMAYENSKYLVLVWKPFCLSDANFEDERISRLKQSLEKKLKLRQSN